MAEQNKKPELDQDMKDLQALLKTEHGQRFLWRVIEQCKLFHSSFTGNSATFFNEGMRSIGLWLMDECLTADPKATANLIINSKQLEKQDD